MQEAQARKIVKELTAANKAAAFALGCPVSARLADGVYEIAFENGFAMITPQALESIRKECQQRK